VDNAKRAGKRLWRNRWIPEFAVMRRTHLGKEIVNSAASRAETGLQTLVRTTGSGKI